VRTLLRLNSLLTGKNTGNFALSTIKSLASIECNCLLSGEFRSGDSLQSRNGTGKFSEAIRELNALFR
jgi:hypothetical protein